LKVGAYFACVLGFAATCNGSVRPFMMNQTGKDRFSSDRLPP